MNFNLIKMRNPWPVFQDGYYTNQIYTKIL